MPAIITDQLRILNARNFVGDSISSENSYYAFVGLPNATSYDSDWDFNPPSPKDSLDQENDCWDTILGLKRIKEGDVSQVIKKVEWVSGTIYDMYRHDITRTKTSKPSGSTSLYSSNFCVVTSDYRVYMCLQNGISPENPEGRPSLDEPKFIDLEPRPAGNSGDGYIWKFLYAIKANEIIKFDSTNFIPVPKKWGEDISDPFSSLIRNNATTSGQLKICTITNRGVGLGTANTIYTDIPIKGDGTDAKCTIVIGSDSTVESITISDGGSGYTYGNVDIRSGNIPIGVVDPTFDVIIPPIAGHGFNIYKDTGSYNVMIYSRIENDTENPDFIIGNQISRVGIIKNPLEFSSNQLLTKEKASGLYALKLIGISELDDYKTTTFFPDSIIYQTIGTGVTAYAKVASYDRNTGVLKYWRDRTISGFNTNGTSNISSIYGLSLNDFTPDIDAGGSLFIRGGTIDLQIDVNFGTELQPGISTFINNKKYQLGQSFVRGISFPEIKKYSGEIIYIDNRPSITRSQNQKEDIKVILQF